MANTHILIVDDNPTNLKLAKVILEKDGYQVESAIDAQEALEILKHSQVDLILMDIAMPGIDGLMLTKILKENNETQHIPIIAVTAFAMKGDKEKAMEAGCDGYISKPIESRNFSEQIEKFLTKKSL